MVASWNNVDVLGVPVAALTAREAVMLCEQTIARRNVLLIGVVNAAKIVNMRRDARLDDAVRTSDIIFADGAAVVWASRLLGRPLPERVTGIDLMHELLALAHRRRYRVYLLGATDDVLAVTVQRMRELYPNAEIAGYRNGYFSEEKNEEVADEIASARPDMLFVAMSPPKKEVFLGRYARRMNVPICHGVGGAFDVMAGKVKRAPLFWQRWGLEWLYRVLQEPRRMWKRYLVTNTLFCSMLLRELLLPRRAARKAVS